MRTFLAALLALSVIAPAWGQGIPVLGNRSARSSPPTDKAPKIKADEKAYKSALDKIPDKKIADPWQNVRGTEPVRGPKN